MAVVQTSNGLQLGFVQRDAARLLFPLLADRAVVVACRVTHVLVRADQPALYTTLIFSSISLGRPVALVLVSTFLSPARMLAYAALFASWRSNCMRSLTDLASGARAAERALLSFGMHPLANFFKVFQFVCSIVVVI